MNTWLHIHDSMEAATKTNKQTNLLLPRNSTILRTPFFIDDCNTPYRHILTSICLSQPPSCKLKKIIGFLFPPSLKFRLEFNFQAWNFYKFLCLCFLQYVVFMFCEICGSFFLSCSQVVQISGIFNPKMALCRTGNITDLFYLQKTMLQVALSGCSIIDGPQ